MSSGSNGKALSAFYSGDGGETRDRRGSSIAGGKWSFIVQLPREKEGVAPIEGGERETWSSDTRSHGEEVIRGVRSMARGGGDGE
jgi:hypothetical protein